MWYTDIATKRPLGAQTEARLYKKHKIILHTMVGSLWGTDAYFRSGGYSGTESHFGVGGDGKTLQWQDDEYQADANLGGNDDAISIETADHGPEFSSWNTSGDNVPSWTGAQIEAIAQIIARVAKRHDIPIRLISDTRDSTKGIGYHRQGVDPYRKHGGEKYSNAYGKVCPGDKRIAQIPQIIKRAQQIAGGEDDDMPSVAEVIEGFAKALTTNTELRQGFAQVMQDVVFADPDVQQSIAVALLDYKNPNVEGGDRTIYQMIRDGATREDLEIALTTPVDDPKRGYRTSISQAGNVSKRNVHESLVTQRALVARGVVTEADLQAAREATPGPDDGE